MGSKTRSSDGVSRPMDRSGGVSRPRGWGRGVGQFAWRNGRDSQIGVPCSLSYLFSGDIGLASTVEIGSNPGATPRWDENEAPTPAFE